MEKLELGLDAKASLGEGAAWDSQRKLLYWVDINGEKVHIYNPKDGSDRAIQVGQPVGTLAPRQKGGLVLAMSKGLYFLDVDSGQLDFISDPESGLPGNRFNDGKCDPAGRFWAGTMSTVGQKKAGSLYRMDPDLSVHKMVDGITTSNGLIWSLDKRTMYYIDTPTMEVSAFDYNNLSGEIRNRRAAVRVPEGEGRPDGMTIDAEGMLWVAMWEGWQVNRYNPLSGEKLMSVSLPVERVTSVAFGGDNLDELYITTAIPEPAKADPAKQPLAGGLFKARPGVRGGEGFSFTG